LICHPSFLLFFSLLKLLFYFSLSLFLILGHAPRLSLSIYARTLLLRIITIIIIIIIIINPRHPLPSASLFLRNVSPCYTRSVLFPSTTLPITSASYRRLDVTISIPLLMYDVLPTYTSPYFLPRFYYIHVHTSAPSTDNLSFLNAAEISLVEKQYHAKTTSAFINVRLLAVRNALSLRFVV
jgi:hypothetical protein